MVDSDLAAFCYSSRSALHDMMTATCLTRTGSAFRAVKQRTAVRHAEVARKLSSDSRAIAQLVIAP